MKDEINDIMRCTFEIGKFIIRNSVINSLNASSGFQSDFVYLGSRNPKKIKSNQF